MATGTTPDLSQIEALLRDLTGKVDALQAENTALQAQVQQTKAAPRFVKRPAEDPHNVSQRRARVMAELRAGQSAGGSKQLPVDAHGKRIPDQMLDQFGPRYEAGDEVRVLREVRRDGFPEGVTWGDVLDKAGSEGVGVVLRQSYLTKLGEWKYIVHVPGLTRRERGDGFYEHEIQPAA
jgi:hypothetical protein